MVKSNQNVSLWIIYWGGGSLICGGSEVEAAGRAPSEHEQGTLDQATDPPPPPKTVSVSV